MHAEPQPAPLPAIDWRSRVVVPLVAAGLFAVLLRSFDGPAYEAVRSIGLSGDFRREIETLGQFGSFSTILIATILMLIFDPKRARRVLDWVFAAVVGSILFGGMKVLLGRGRPKLGDPNLYAGPTGAVTDPSDGQVLRAIEGAAELQAMPSSHTTHAVIAAVFLMTMYPRLTVLVVPWAALVGYSRLALGAHWPTDVLVGACLAYPLAYICVTRYWGVRFMDFVWRRFVDPKGAQAYYPRMRALDERAG